MPSAFAADPVVHALFAPPDDIADMLGKSRELREFLAEPANAQAMNSSPCSACAAGKRR
jgi:hypothetical protein